MVTEMIQTLNKVYVVTEGSYSEYHIVKVCISLEAASRFRRDMLKEDYNRYLADSREKTVKLQQKKIRLDSTGMYAEEYWEDIEVPNPNLINGKPKDFDQWAIDYGAYHDFDIEEYEVYE